MAPNEAIVQRIVALAERYKAMGVEPKQYRFSSSGNDPDIPFWRFEQSPLGREEREIAKAIVELNPRMLSRQDVQMVLRFPLITNLVDNRDDYDYATGETLTPLEAVHREVKRLAAYSKITTVEVPILHSLLMRGESLSWGGVVFKGLNPWSDLSDVVPELKHLIDYFDGRLNGWATIDCPGDGMRLWQHLNDTIETALRQMVGAAWPRHRGAGHAPPSLPGRGTDSSPTPRFEPGRLDRAMSTKLPPGHAQYRVPRELQEDWGEDWTRLLEIAQRDEARTKAEQSLMDALGWLGSATEPDLPAMKIVKVATALETLISEHDANANSRGVNAMLAERTALLVGSAYDERMEVDRRVKELYDLRSSVLHRQGIADEDAIGDAGLLVWRACRALLGKLPEIEAAGGLRNWALTRRYS